MVSKYLINVFNQVIVMCNKYLYNCYEIYTPSFPVWDSQSKNNSYIDYFFICFPTSLLSTCFISGQRKAYLEPTAGRGGGREKGREGGREAVMRLPMTEKQSVRPEHTDHSHAHMHKTARE